MGPPSSQREAGRPRTSTEQTAVQLRAGRVFVDLVERKKTELAQRLECFAGGGVLFLGQRAGIEHRDVGN